VTTHLYGAKKQFLIEEKLPIIVVILFQNITLHFISLRCFPLNGFAEHFPK